MSPNALFSVFQAGTDLVGLDYEDKDEQNGEGCISPHGEFAIYPLLFSSASRNQCHFPFLLVRLGQTRNARPVRSAALPIAERPLVPDFFFFFFSLQTERRHLPLLRRLGNAREA